MKKILISFLLIFIIFWCNKDDNINDNNTQSWQTHTWTIKELSQENWKIIKLLAFWEEPFWDLEINWDKLIFNWAALTEAKNYDIKLSQNWENYAFFWNWISWEFIMEQCVDNSIWDVHNYKVKLNVLDTDFEWCWDINSKEEMLSLVREMIQEEFLSKYPNIWELEEASFDWKTDTTSYTIDWYIFPDKQVDFVWNWWEESMFNTADWVDAHFSWFVKWDFACLREELFWYENINVKIDIYCWYIWELKTSSLYNIDACEALLNASIINSSSEKDYFELLNSTIKINEKDNKRWLYMFSIMPDFNEEENKSILNLVVTEHYDDSENPNDKDDIYREVNTRRYKLDKEKNKIYKYDVVNDSYEEIIPWEDFFERYLTNCKK